MSRPGGVALVATGLILATVLYLWVPILLIGWGATHGMSNAGFGRGAASLAVLSLFSVLLALASSVVASGVCLTASLLGCFFPDFAVFYNKWLFVMLFTNPVFLVFGFSILLANIEPRLAVVLSSAYILMPFCGITVQAAVAGFDPAQIRAASSLGASQLYIAVRHILPAVQRQVLAAVLLGAFYAVGFYMVPSFVGLGRVVTLGTVIHTMANNVGDWTAASQLCCIAVLAQGALLLLWAVTIRLTVRKARPE